ncbi:DUF3224 domain-containing protein [Tahibacter amnicola]|uniref:DUF3224 domain-containing protein n=1 Tax=Tahibacter amnicola TaxID=2976241 RepID=A0ABY6B9K1_9GAMM|nr:DUF3224 domain-containing protein [Tahibacter amnicola]UXI66354.1 DUF3224 domain-containing protein [Tahibacter amnicola]
MNHTIQGLFDVSLVAQPTAEDASGAILGRRSIDKRYHGELDATSRGEMLSAGSPQTGSAGYVAIEKVTGTLGGRRGSFYLQHSGTMSRGDHALQIIVIPDSGTDELVGLRGRMGIRIADGKHYYDFDYSLDPPQDQQD